MDGKIAECRLFRGVDPQAINSLTNENSTTRSYARGDVVAPQGSRCGSLMILAEGQLVASFARKGASMHSETLSAPALVAPDCLFSENPVLPATFTARTPVTVLYMQREDFIYVMQRDARVMRNFLEILSLRDKSVSDRAIYFDCKTIKGKLARYFLDRASGEGSLEFRNILTQREMADMFGVTRPALARALGELSRQGAVYVQGKQVTILFEEKLKQLIKQ